jgi:flagellar P-ring protein precursor FlgI
MHRLLFAAIGLLIAAGSASAQVRIKDITDVAGARDNQLFGFGLVVGLDQTGSRSTFTQQVAVDLLQRLGVTTQIFSQNPSDSIIRSTCVSAVMVVADIGPFSHKGSRIDVTVSAFDDSTSLKGGTLVLTPLRGADGQVYALAQGPMSIGGFSITGGGQQTSGIQKNHLNVGRIPGGGIVEKEAPGELVINGKAGLLLKEPDFNTARLIAKVINDRYPGVAVATDPGAVTLCMPPDPCKAPTQFLAEIGLLEIRPDTPARIVINERTGTVVAGEHVTISTTAISHGNLYIGIGEPYFPPQQNQLGAPPVVTPPPGFPVTEQRSRLLVVPRATTVADVARALNALGVTPRDLIAIFQALKQSGALHAELVLI